MDVFILLDRTGSMAAHWRETVESVNGYVEEFVRARGAVVVQPGVEAMDPGQPQSIGVVGEEDHVTLAVFDLDKVFQFDVVRSGSARAWIPLKETEVQPRGDTPLYDACQRIAAMAEEQNSPRTVVVVVSDGEENSSREVTRDQAQAAFDRLRAKGWQVVFLGVAFDAFKQAERTGTAFGQTISATPQGLAAAMRRTAASSSAYGHTGSQMHYTREDRVDAGEDLVVDTKVDTTGGSRAWQRSK